MSGATFRITRGEVVGVIGPSGAGKSTLAQLLLGLRDPTTGSLRVGDEDLREVDRVWWSGRVAFVAQDALLFTGTVAENIRFFRDGIDDDTLRWAASQANVLSDIEALPRRLRHPPRANGAASCPAVSASGCRSPEPLPGARHSSCWTSPPPLWTAGASR